MRAPDWKFIAVYLYPHHHHHHHWIWHANLSFVGSDRCLFALWFCVVSVSIRNWMTYKHQCELGTWSTIPQYETGYDHDDNFGRFPSYHTTNASGGPVPLDSSVVVRCESQVGFVPNKKSIDVIPVGQRSRIIPVLVVVQQHHEPKKEIVNTNLIR